MLHPLPSCPGSVYSSARNPFPSVHCARRPGALGHCKSLRPQFWLCRRLDGRQQSGLAGRRLWALLLSSTPPAALCVCGRVCAALHASVKSSCLAIESWRRRALGSVTALLRLSRVRQPECCAEEGAHLQRFQLSPASSNAGSNVCLPAQHSMPCRFEIPGQRTRFQP